MNKQKEWYKKWWGIILAVLLLPFFIIWYVWAKSKWSKVVKIAVTAVAVVFVIGVMASSPETQQTSQQTAQNTSSQPQQQEQSKQEEAPKEEPKKDDSELKADVKRAYDVPGIEITNLEAVDWITCQLTLNSDYKREIRNPLQPNEPLNNPYALFTKDDGTKFDPETTAVKTVLIRCEVNGNTRYGVYEF